MRISMRFLRYQTEKGKEREKITKVLGEGEKPWGKK